jgi:hypothetical protein
VFVDVVLKSREQLPEHFATERFWPRRSPREKRGENMAKIHTITRAHERELLTIWRDRSRLNISCANCRNFRRQRATPTGVSDMPVFAFPYRIERFWKRQRDKLDQHISNTA